MNKLSLDYLIAQIKSHPDFSKVGMIASHLGIVRAFSRGGQKVKAMDIQVDMQKVQEIIEQKKKSPGIVDILVEVKQGKFQVGEEVMAVVVAGDFRENVFSVLMDVVNLIKEKAVQKREE